MKNRQSRLFNKFRFTLNRLRNGLFLLTARNFLTRFGLDIDPYYWEREGLNLTTEPRIRGEALTFRVTHVTAEEIGMLDTILEMNTEQIQKDIKNGQGCIGLKCGNEMAALMCVETKDFMYKYRRFTLDSNEAYMLNMYTFDAFRGKNLAPYLRYHSYKLLEEQGIDRIYSISAYFNKSSLKFKQKLNVQHLQLLLYIGLFKKFHWNYTLKKY